MKKFVLIFLCSFICFLIHAQIYGKLTDSSQNPISLSTVVLLRSVDSSASQTVLSDSAGMFYFRKISPGTYMLQVRSIGFEHWQSLPFQIWSNDTSFDIGQIKLSASKENLHTVTVIGRKPLVAHIEGGLSVDVAQSPMTPGSSVLQVLSRMPGIMVDQQGNGMSLNGKSGVVVMIDGKLMRLPLMQVISLLNSMPADNLERIELLTSPPARYDAEGTAGIINIITKKNKKPGTGGSGTVMLGQGRGVKAAANGSIDYHHKGSNLHAYYEYDLDHGYGYLFAQGTENVPVIGGATQFQYNGISRPKNKFHGAGISLDQQLSTQVRIGASMDTYFTIDPSQNHNYGNYQLPDSNLIFNSMINGTNNSRYLHPNIYLEKNAGKNKRFRLEFDYLGLRSTHLTSVNSNFTDSLFAPIQRNVGNSTIDLWVAKMDISLPMGKRLFLETGWKGSATKNRSYSDLDNLINGQWASVSAGTANDIASTETVGAAYLSMHWSPDSLTDISIGGRYEYSHNGTGYSLNTAYAIDRTTSNFFPSVFLQHRINEKMSWQLACTQRIQRPSYSDLASYVTYNDPVSVFTGNPALLPTITSQVRLSWTFSDYLAAISYSYDDRPIFGTQIMTGTTPGLIYLMPENGNWQKNLLLEVIVPIKIFSWWKLQPNWVGGSHQYHISYFPQLLAKGYWSYSANLVSTMKFSSRDILEISGYYNSSFFVSNGDSKGNFLANLGYRRQLPGNWGSIQLSVTDVLMSTNYHSRVGQLIKDAFDSNVQVAYFGESHYFPVVKLSYSRRFGSSANHKQSAPGTGDEQRRL